MLPYIDVFGRQVSMYALCIMIGLVLGILAAFFRAKIYNCPREDVLYASFYGILGLIAGGKLLFLMTNLPWILKHAKEILENREILSALLTGGFVFYGGVLGAAAGVCLYAKQYRLRTGMLLEILVPSVPLIHALGRVGCFCAGCCYGLPMDPPWGIYFVNSLSAPRDISFFPVQLLEAGCNLVIFLCLKVRYKSKKTKGEASCFYLLSYGILRFVLEFLRADPERGFFLGLSTSQWISIALVASVPFIRKRISCGKLPES